MQLLNANIEHDGNAFRCPKDLAVTGTDIRRALIIGQCTADHMRLFLMEIGIECDFVHIQSMNDPSFKPPHDIDSYDLQIIFLPFDVVMPNASYFPLSYDDLDGETKRFDASEKKAQDLLDLASRWLDSHRILTFVGNFLVPQQNPVGRLLPKYDLRNPCYFVEKLNESISIRLDQMENAYLVDIDGIASTFGKKYLLDDSIWSIAHGGFITNVEDENYESKREESDRRLEELGSVDAYYTVRTHDGYVALRNEILSMYRAVRQIDAVKLVVIDLDDTAWRGVAAEEDSSHDFMTLGWPLGFIEALMFLKRRGILLAIVSKNEAENATRAWQKAYGDIFPIDNFVSVKANWLPKHQNMQQILNETNLLAQNTVYIDDNPAEREIIQTTFQGIRTIGSNPYYTRRILLWSPETQVPSISAESQVRTESIKGVMKREDERASMDHADFLVSLEIKCGYSVTSSISDLHFKRSIELINKTNQFNTTGKRWSVEELDTQFQQGMRLFSFFVDDRFTKYGAVCVAIVNGDHIEQMVMSCRVIGLGVEFAALSVVLAQLAAEGFQKVRASAKMTDKNVLSRDLYSKGGFHRNGDEEWVRGLDVPYPEPEHIVFAK
ncbi:HAD-IIIC family phosphatase [Sphingomonas sp. R86521]|uniref:HAD-IIIC family phosphatase n=1 Tax=Sphingomonas sp. R86521 TaxID=3093860 RepID=UPI0036D35BCB